MSAQLASKLRLLARAGCLPSSACGAAFLRELRPLMEAGLVARERSGSGWRMVVRDGAALDDLLARRYPGSDGPDTGRVAGVARHRDSKSVANDTPPVVLLRAWRDVLADASGRSCDAVEATRRHGVLGVVLGSTSAYRVGGTLALVENPAVFLRVEELGLGLDAALGVNGRVHGRVLAWLAAQAADGLRVVHLPDYDPTGLTEFHRVRDALGGRAVLHLPPDLGERFGRYASPRLLDGIQSRSMLARLRGSSLPEVRHVVELIDRHNGGLEQEALLVPPGAG